MNSKFEEKLRYWLRQASDEACRGFCYDKDEEEMDENWVNFEEEAIQDIDNFLSNCGMPTDW
jgi:hypothetical protein